ncbi:MAG: class I SAM-dependent methyltransferase [Pseudomonadota bacterium]
MNLNRLRLPLVMLFGLWLSIPAIAANAPPRSAADLALDASRKPLAVLDFFGIEPGMAVLDIFAGGGYYTELLSQRVGADGFVTHYNNQPWNDFVGKAVEERLGNDRLPNVDRYVAAPEDLVELPDQYDAAIFVLGMHDIYYADPDNGWVPIDRDRFLRGIYNVIAEGGVLGVIDHNAAPGSDPAIVGKTLHRIDPAILIRDLTAVGFTLEASSDLLRNGADDHTGSVFDPALRWATDRSVLRFRK